MLENPKSVFDNLRTDTNTELFICTYVEFSNSD